MSERDVRERVLEVITAELGMARDTVHDHDRVVDLGADSLDRIEIAIHLQELFEIQITDHEMADVDTVGELVALVSNKLQGRPRATSKLTLRDVQAILAEVQYKDWTFVADYAPRATAMYLQPRFRAADGTEWSGRKWLISPHMTRSEVVQTALKAVLTAEEHEARELFTYRGRAIFGPHFDVEQLVELCDRGALDAREPAVTESPEFAPPVATAQADGDPGDDRVGGAP